MDILQILADSARKRVEEYKNTCSADEMKSLALSMDKGNFEFENSLKTEGLSFICECKKASPSKGIIDENFDYLNIALDYEAAGASCISVLTEPTKFLGKDEYIQEICKNVSIPVLRKDFTVDEYMIYQAKTFGADCVLLICSILDTDSLREYIKICDSLGISALVEAHDEREIHMGLDAGARIIGVNNRNLTDFTVDMSNSCALRSLVPPEVIFVSESGVKTRGDVRQLENQGVDACLVGESMMRAEDKKSFLDYLRYD